MACLKLIVWKSCGFQVDEKWLWWWTDGKILIMTVQVDFEPIPGMRHCKFTWIVIIEYFTINFPSQPTTLVAFNFFRCPFWAPLVVVNNNISKVNLITVLHYNRNIDSSFDQWILLILKILCTKNMWPDLRKGVVHTHPLSWVWRIKTLCWNMISA